MSETDTTNSGGGAPRSLRERCTIVMVTLSQTFWGRLAVFGVAYVVVVSLIAVVSGHWPQPAGPLVAASLYSLFSSKTPEQYRYSLRFIACTAATLLLLAWLLRDLTLAAAGTACVIVTVAACIVRLRLRKRWPAGAWMLTPDGQRHDLRLHAQQCRHSGTLHWRAYAPGGTAIIVPADSTFGLDYGPPDAPPVTVEAIRDEDGRIWCQPKPARWLV